MRKVSIHDGLKPTHKRSDSLILLGFFNTDIASICINCRASLVGYSKNSEQKTVHHFLTSSYAKI